MTRRQAPSVTTSDLQDVQRTLRERMGTHRDDLDDLVRIPSVSAPGFDAAQVRRSAEWVRDKLAERGFQHVRLLEVDGGHPAVYGDHLHAEGAPTLLLYAHHDVQPPGDESLWTSPAFTPTERDGRLYARGAADDKAGVLLHVAAVDAWLQSHASLPVNVKVIVEGEEETGSEHLGDFLGRYRDLLRADVVVVADTDNWQVGVPGLTYLLRGLVDCEVELRGLDHALHSGMYGGPIPDPVTGMVKLLAGLVDDRGVVAIPSFADDVREPSREELARLRALDFDEARFRAESGLLDGVELIGDAGRHPLERLWLQPCVTVIGFDAPAVATASNTLAPAARAAISVRLAPGQDPLRARDLLCRWLQERAPWGLQVTVTPGAACAPFVTDPFSGASRPVFEAAARALEAAYGHPVVYQGLGGSIPFLNDITRAFTTDPSRPVPALLLGVEDPDTRAHGIDESLHLGDWARACLGEAYLFAGLAEGVR
ncbi:MAG: M20/M25/M40 family metallo-hydrolase [Euzebyales bacterium]|nr:M20/M25/M40 family metallo-hydrolase [Euzebyales bacterium]